MRRRHNVTAATLLVFGITYLCARREGDLLEASHSDGPAEILNIHDEITSFADVGRDMRVGSSAKIYSWPLSIGKLKDQKQEFKQPTFQGPTQLLDQISPATGIPEARPVESASSPLETIDHSRSPNTGYAFQEDLNIDLPLSILQRFSSQAPQNYNPGGPTKYAYATFMASRNPSPKDPYFLAIHSVIHRILWSPRTRTQKNIPFIVFVADFVTQEQRALFAGAGAVVRELKPLDYHCDSTNFQSRWKDLFTKLNMWAETDFERILFLDADAFPLTNIDAVFDVAPVQDCVEDKLQIDDFLSDRTPVCEPYVFAGVSDNPLDVAHSGINVGSMVFSPSLRMHQRLVQNYLKTDHYDCGMAEQAFLNWQFNTDSAYPSTKLDREWGGYFPKEDEMGRLKVVHEKIWVARDGWTAFEWKKGCVEMVEWYGSAEFMQQRRPL